MRGKRTKSGLFPKTKPNQLDETMNEFGKKGKKLAPGLYSNLGGSLSLREAKKNGATKKLDDLHL